MGDLQAAAVNRQRGLSAGSNAEAKSEKQREERESTGEV